MRKKEREETKASMRQKQYELKLYVFGESMFTGAAQKKMPNVSINWIW